MKLALVTIVTANLELMRTFYQAVLQIEPQIYRGNYVEFTLETGTLALWRQSECAEYGLDLARGAAGTAGHRHELPRVPKRGPAFHTCGGAAALTARGEDTERARVPGATWT